MSDHKEEVKVNFSGTAILSFAIVLVFILFFATCHGPYNSDAGKAAIEQPSDK